MNRLTQVLVIVSAAVTLAARPQQTAGPNPSAASAPTGFILGQVVDIGTGKPIPEATVTVTVRGAGAGQPVPQGRAGGPLGQALGRGAGANGPNPVRLLTDTEGRFVVHDLPKGVVNITAIASGYVQGSVGQARPTGPARPIDLDEGERLTDVKIRLWKHAVVTGTVVDENGEPSVGMTVRMLRQSMVNGKPKYMPGAQAKTDDRGVYRISAITPGTFLMAVPQTIATMPSSMVDAIMQSMASSAPQGTGMLDLMSAGASAPNMGGGAGFRVGDLLVSVQSGGLPPPSGDRLFVYQTLFHPSGATLAEGGVLTLGSGDTRAGVDFQLRVLPTARVSGTVIGPAGPVSGTPIRLVPAGGVDFSNDGGLETATAVSAGDGSFQLLGVPSGQYSLSIVKPASAPMPAAMASNPLMQFAVMGGMSAAGQPVPLYAQASLSVGAEDVTGVSLTLSEGARVSGRIEFVGATPPPTTAQLRAAAVVLTPADGRSLPAPGFNATDRVNQDAQFKTAGYPSGKYLVSMNPTPSQWAISSVTIGGRDVTDGGIDLKDSDVGDVVIAYTDKISSLTGNVRTPAGAPTATATVVAFPADYEAWIANGMTARRSRTAVATKKGAFTMTGLPAGDYLLAATDDADMGDPRDPQFLGALARAATKITIVEGDKKAQDLQTVKAVVR